MIELSNGHHFTYMVASGAAAFDGKYWLWEKPFLWAGLIKPKLFTIVIKSLTLEPRKGNLSWWHPWTCVALMKGGSTVNKVGLTNPGVDWWCETIGPSVDRKIQPMVGSIFGTRDELVVMARKLNPYDLVGLEINVSCPNTGHALDEVQTVVDSVKAVKEISRHPIIIKLSVAQQYCAIVKQLEDVAEAVALNSVPWEKIHPSRRPARSPLWRLEKKVGGGGGGVSGRLAQELNWKAVFELNAHVHAMPVIAPSIMSFEDMLKVQSRGARAFSFGAVHIRTPWRPTQLVKRHMRDYDPRTMLDDALEGE